MYVRIFTIYRFKNAEFLFEFDNHLHKYCLLNCVRVHNFNLIIIVPDDVLTHKVPL